MKYEMVVPLIKATEQENDVSTQAPAYHPEMLCKHNNYDISHGKFKINLKSTC